MTEQKCIGCEIVKPVSEFHRSKIYKSGYYSRCKECRNADYRQKVKTAEPKVQSKICSGCKVLKPASDFQKQQSNADGLCGKCKDCYAADRKTRKDKWREIPLNLPAEKSCIRCKVSKSYSEFNKHSGEKDGHCRYCMDCDRQIQRSFYDRKREANDQQWRQRQRQNQKASHDRRTPQKKEQDLTRAREWRKSNPRKSSQLSKEWRRKNKERNSQTKRRWFEKNTLRYYIAIKRWKQNNPERDRLRAKRGFHARRAKLLSGGTFTNEQWLSLCNKYGNTCLCCAKQKPLTIDHVIPVSKGGANTIDNLQPLCMTCNLRKGTKSTDYRPITS